MARRRHLLEPGTPQPIRTGGNDWDLCVTAFLESMTLRNLSWYTKKHHKENLKSLHNLITSLGFTATPDRITTDILKKAVIHMIEVDKLSPTTINHRIRTCHQFFSFLLSEGYLTDNPSSAIKKIKATKTIIEAFTEDQVRECFCQPKISEC